MAGSVEGRIVSRTYSACAATAEDGFHSDGGFLDVNLHDELNHVTTKYAAFHFVTRITSLTSISFNATRSEDRFEFSPLRDSVSTMLGTTVTSQFPSRSSTAALRSGCGTSSPDRPDVPAPIKGRDHVARSGVQHPWHDTVRRRRAARHSILLRRQSAVLPADRLRRIAQQIFGPFDTVSR